jgi:hydrogenase/urease accessory protein HupE
MFEKLNRSLWRWLLLSVCMVLISGHVHGHSMDQVRAEITAGKEGWQGSVWMEAWALYPEDGPKIPAGKPGDPDSAGDAWVANLSSDDHRKMRETAAEFLSESFVLTLGGKRLMAEFGFPDYSTERPVLKLNEAGNALVRVDLHGDFPKGLSGMLELAWLDDEDQPLAVEVKTPRPDGKVRKRLWRLAPNDEPLEMMEIQATGELVESKAKSTLAVWIVAGFTHILPLGIDHILFILGLFLLQPKLKPLLWQTSAFTLAHSITLALVVLGVITAPARIVEPMIALSIAYVGIENLWVKELKPWRVALVFGLGLLHGMGFASVMQELELPVGQVIEPLVGFNLGVEFGQLAVLALAFVATFWLFKKPAFDIVRKVASGLIAVVGLYWTVERIVG